MNPQTNFYEAWTNSSYKNALKIWMEAKKVRFKGDKKMSKWTISKLL